MLDSSEVAGKSSIKTIYSQTPSNGAILSSTYDTKQLNLCATSSVRHMVIYSWLLSACPGKEEHSSTDKPQKQATAIKVY